MSADFKTSAFILQSSIFVSSVMFFTIESCDNSTTSISSSFNNLAIFLCSGSLLFIYLYVLAGFVLSKIAMIFLKEFSLYFFFV